MERRIKEAIQQAITAGIFNDEELKEADNQTRFATLKSWEFWQIFYISNEELYYLFDEAYNVAKSYADEIHQTDKGVILCYK